MRRCPGGGGGGGTSGCEGGGGGGQAAAGKAVVVAAALLYLSLVECCARPSTLLQRCRHHHWSRQRYERQSSTCRRQVAPAYPATACSPPAPRTLNGTSSSCSWCDDDCGNGGVFICDRCVMVVAAALL